MSNQEFVLQPGRLTMADTRRLSEPGSRIVLDPATREAVRAAHAVVDRAVSESRRVYGINTGMGSLADSAIDVDLLSELQHRLILSNAAGTGEPLPDRVVRRTMLLKINTLGLANSGVSETMVDALINLFNRDAHPCIPSKGSVGASGDLAPLAHLGAAMMGEGEMRLCGETVPAGDALARLGLEPFVPAPKEGLAMVNGTQVSLALALEGLFAFEDVFAAALVAGALSVEAALGSAVPFDERIHRVRGQHGQADVAAVYRRLLEDSGFRAASVESGRVQDPYSLRCQPQVLGAALDAMRFASDVLGREVNAMTDNPLIFADTGDVLYGGNFHAQPVGLAADVLALALAETGSMAERRIALLTDAHMSGLPPFLAADSGLNSGFMVAHVTAAALASENKALATPRSTDSLPTTANQEDYVSMATHAARRLVEMADNLAGIVAIELLASCQGVYLRRPLRSGATLEQVVERVHAAAPAFDEDRYFAPSIEAVKALIVSGDFRSPMPETLLPSALCYRRDAPPRDPALAENETIAAFRRVAERLRNGTGASRTTIRVDCARLGLEMETVAVESRDSSARALEGQRTPAVREGAAVRWLAKHRRTFVMEDCLDPWDPEVAPEDYVIERYGIRSEMVAGVFRGVELVGIVSVHYTRGPRSWSDGEVAMIESACEEVLALLDTLDAAR